MGVETQKRRDPYITAGRQVLGFPLPLSGEEPVIGETYKRYLRTFPTVAVETLILPIEAYLNVPLTVDITVEASAMVKYQVWAGNNKVGEAQTRVCTQINSDAVLARAGTRLSPRYFEELERDLGR